MKKLVKITLFVAVLGCALPAFAQSTGTTGTKKTHKHHHHHHSSTTATSGATK